MQIERIIKEIITNEINFSLFLFSTLASVYVILQQCLIISVNMC